MWLGALWLLRLIVLLGMMLFLGRIAARVWQDASTTASGVSDTSGHEERPVVLRLIKTREGVGVFSSATGFRLAQGDELPLSETLTIGRGEENDLVLHDSFVSARHLRIARDGLAWWLEDLGSRNGTIVNGRKVTGRHRLSPGDRITVGSNSFAFMG